MQTTEIIYDASTELYSMVISTKEKTSIQML